MNRNLDVPDEYVALYRVYEDAYEQAACGKGKERHASEGEAYEDQIICEVTRRLGPGYPLGQAVKKIYESQRIGGERGVAELLGALNYVAAAVIVMREGLDTAPKADEEPKFKHGDKVQRRVTLPSVSDRIWVDTVYVQPMPNGQGHIVKDEKLGRIAVDYEDIRPAPKAEGCEDLVRDAAIPEEYEGCMMMLEADAPQTKEELLDRILSCNPATYGRAHKPTGEELAEMAEEEPHG